ncbi:FAD-dependent oxidoreductase [Anaerorhabdus sp.]|uniref:FAD-dependent oxidoreductase n=1 Tax=Anaerorhabdus sp. TaxID=1872524 RepID=UPI002FCBB23B
MNTLELKKGITWTGVLDPNLRIFDIIMETKFGTSYNSYLVEGSEKIALVETAKLNFFDDYLETLKSLIDVSKIDYVVLNHTEPDHTGSLEKLIEINPNLVIVATPVAIGFLKEIMNCDFYSIAIKDGETLSLGNKTLHFMTLPNLHWPDTMFTYLEEDKTLFTCDSFGAHYSFEDVLRSKVVDEEGYQEALKYYFDNIIGPFKRPFMQNALKRIQDLDIQLICTGHGPVLDAKIPELIAQYHTWVDEKNPNVRKTVIIPYVSAYGYTAQLANKIKDGIKAAGTIDVRLYDMNEADKAKVLEEIGYADGFLLGTPTIVGEALEPIWELAIALHSPVHAGKLASAFGSYGWSGEGVPHIIERLKQVRLKVIDGFRIRFKPSESNLVEAFDFGYNFGCVLMDKKNEKLEPKKSGKVKCMICGAILDDTEDICPVCGVGKENFIAVEDLTLTYHHDTKEHYVILGGGVAAYNAAREIRFRNDTCKITMISEESYLPYNRPMLTKALLANFTENQMAIEKADWYKNNKINLKLNTKVLSIHPDKKEVILDNGETLTYDKCIYALGSTCFVPPIEGHTLKQVIAIRGVGDVKQITELLPDTKHVVVIGGGVLGLEAAWEMHKTKCKVTVLELLPHLMPRQLDEGASTVLRKILEKNHIDLHTNVKIKRIAGTDKVEGVELEDGTIIPADLVLISAGVRANTKIATDAGIEVNRAIIVNDHMETNIKDIYAAGDCAEYDNINYALWSEAVDMGIVAGANAAGDDKTYQTVLGALSFFGLNTNLYAIGDTGKNPDIQYKTVEVSDTQKGTYEKLYFANNLLCGFILLGDLKKMKDLTNAYLAKSSFADVLK